MPSRLDIKTVRERFEKQGHKLLESEYINSSIPMKYRCSCGNISYCNTNNIGRGDSCRECRNKKIGDSGRFSLDYVNSVFKDRSCCLLSQTYKNSNQLLEYICPCGNLNKTSFAHFHSGQTCQCSQYRPRGKEHYRFDESITEEERIIGRNYPEYQDWRKSVFIRDLYSCQSCGYNNNLNAHHILPYSTHKDKRTDVENGITLCHDCHTEFHVKYGKVNISRNEIDSFINGKIELELK